MNDEILDRLARINGITALLESIKANIEAMKADNAERESHGLAQAWPGSMFQEAANELHSLSILFVNEVQPEP